jgi:alkylhydroperoxidase family enzyme
MMRSEPRSYKGGLETPRVPPLKESEWTDEVRELLTLAGRDKLSRLNIYTTVARHPGLMRRWLPFGGKLLYKGKLSDRSRELAVLRTAWLCQAPYEWAQHVLVAHSIGMTSAEIQAVISGPSDSSWNELEAAIIRSVDELHSSASITDETWATLSDRFDEQLLIELIMLVGHYHSVSYLLNSLGVPLDDDIPDGLSSR